MKAIVITGRAKEIAEVLRELQRQEIGISIDPKIIATAIRDISSKHF